MICEAVKTDVKEPKGLIERILRIEGTPVCEISPTVVLTTESPQIKDQLVPENPNRISTASVQGALLLQAMLRLQSPHNEVVIRRLLFYLLRIFPLTMIPARSFEQLLPEARLALAHDATSSRVIDAMFESPTVTRKSKRTVIMAYIGTYHLLVDDRIGSRVGDRCWANADPYLKVNRSLQSRSATRLIE